MVSEGAQKRFAAQAPSAYRTTRRRVEWHDFHRWGSRPEVFCANYQSCISQSTALTPLSGPMCLRELACADGGCRKLVAVGDLYRPYVAAEIDTGLTDETRRDTAMWNSEANSETYGNWPRRQLQTQNTWKTARYWGGDQQDPRATTGFKNLELRVVHKEEPASPHSSQCAHGRERTDIGLAGTSIQAGKSDNGCHECRPGRQARRKRA